MPDAFALDQARLACMAALEHSEDLAPLWTASRNGQADLLEARRIMPDVRVEGDAVARLARIKSTLEQQGHPVGNGAFERMLIVAAAHDSLDELMALPVDERVREFFCQNFEAYAAARVPEPFDLGRASFVCMARIATLSRFPAGQLDWEVSGIPRSWLLRVSARQLPRLLAAILFELGGLGPAFFSHVNPNRRGQGILLERESLRSYHRMARTMERQPEIRGLITASWLHSPDTFAVSPHLSWLNAVFVENGGHIIPLGRVDVESGVLHRSPERQQAFDAGTFIPTEALVIWPRRAMLAWAAQHEELREDFAPRAKAALRMREARA